MLGQYPELPSGCEATAVAMVLQWAGANASKVDVANALQREPMLWSENGTTRGGNPHRGFVGNPFKKESFGVFAKPMVEIVDSYLPGHGVDLTGKTFADLLAVVDSGRPVAAWVTNKLEEPKINATWYTTDGRRIVWQTPEHVMVIIGYTDSEIIVNDGADGTIRYYNRARFISIWEKMGRHALTVSVTPQMKFQVFQNDKLLREFASYTESVSYAKLWARARVVDKTTGELKWDNIYSQVFQYNNYLGDFASQTGAIQYAQKWSNAKVVDVGTNKITWNNWPRVVYQGDQVIKQFPHTETYWAIEYAKQYADSKVVDGATGAVLWKFPK